MIQELLAKYPEHENLFMFCNEPDAHYKRVGNTEAKAEKKKQKRNAKIKIHHFKMESLLKTPAAVENFYNLIKQKNPDLTEEDYNKAIEHYKSNKWLEERRVGSSKKTEFHWVK